MLVKESRSGVVQLVCFVHLGLVLHESGFSSSVLRPELVIIGIGDNLPQGVSPGLPTLANEKPCSRNHHLETEHISNSFK